MKNISKDEQVWTTIRSKGQQGCHIITSKKSNRDYYYIYATDGESYTKLGRGKSPIELEEKWLT